MTDVTTSPRRRPPRQPRADGARTRAAILRTAAALATTDGLEGLSIGNLAAATGISKSGLYAHFGSKQDLQLATVDGGQRRCGVQDRGAGAFPVGPRVPCRAAVLVRGAGRHVDKIARPVVQSQLSTTDRAI